MKNNKKKVLVYFDEFQYNTLKVECIFEKKTFTAKINEIINIYLKSKSN